MCGFFGEWAFSDKTNRDLLKSISSLSGKRGPDSTDFSEVDDLFLCFNRLAILDPGPSGMQPMKSPSGRYTMVYNGEVYNHLEIRRNLKGHYKGHSDTETIVNAFDKYGVSGTVDFLDGMFAMAVWDGKEKQLYLIRDFAGIKPLFYGINYKGVVFASQYDQVVLHPWFRDNELNPQVLKLYLTQHFIPGPFGIVKETGQVRPGEIITIKSNHKMTRRRYWEFPEYVDSEFSDQDVAIELLSHQLSVSVHNEMLSDVLLGTFLSGGIDSPLVTCYAKHKNPDLKSFSIGSDSIKHDESQETAWYAKEIGVHHYLMKMDSKSALQYWETSMDALHEPFADFSLLPTYVMSNWARKEVTVALSGDGGDELFFGYERFWSIAKNIQYHQGPYWWKYLLYGTDRIFSGNKHINSAILSSSQGIAHQGLHSRFNESWLNNIFPYLQEINLPDKFDIYQYSHQTDEYRLLGLMRKAEFYGMMQKTLRKVDLASMENSLEVRVPFLKKSFIETALKVDPYLSYGPRIKKQILKDILKQELPDAPIDNRKRGFSIPLSQWIKKDLKEPILDLIRNSQRNKLFGINNDGLDIMIEDHLKSKRDAKWTIFTIYALLKWQENLERSRSFIQSPTSTQLEAARPS